MITKIKNIYLKNRLTIDYIICGGLTTLVDFAVYWFFTRIIQIGEVPAQIVSIAAAIVFAFAVNKIYVFRSKTNTLKEVFIQFISFCSMRILSGAFQTFAIWLFVVKLGIYDMIVKILVAVIIVILNYIFSKSLIFKKRD